MTTNHADRSHQDVIVVTFDDADGKFIVTEHVAVIVNQRVRQHGATAAVTVIFWFLLAPALSFVVGGFRRVAEIREDRRLRLWLGMSPLRHRISWGWVAAAWGLLSMVGYLCFFTAFAFLWPDLSEPATGYLALLFPFVVFGGAVAAGFVQARASPGS